MLQRIRDAVPGFVAQVTWKGRDGFSVTEEHQVTIAAQACMLVAFQDTPVFWDVDEVHVYPSVLPQRGRPRGPDGHVIAGATTMAGPVMLAWDHVLAGSRGYIPDNVVIHEFAHKLDLFDALLDGVPVLQSAEQRAYFDRVSAEAFDKHRSLVEMRWPTSMGEYAATSRAEFFAVTTEALFMRPEALAEEHPELFKLLCAFYKLTYE